MLACPAAASGGGAPAPAASTVGSSGAPLAASALPSVVQGLLRCVGDRNKFVQQSACSGIANLVDHSMHDDKTLLLHPYLRVSRAALPRDAFAARFPSNIRKLLT